jgi:hypothetical protein
MPEPFGKRNRRVVAQPPSQPRRPKAKPAQTELSIKPYLYAAGGLLFLVLAGYALAQ